MAERDPTPHDREIHAEPGDPALYGKGDLYPTPTAHEIVTTLYPEYEQWTVRVVSPVIEWNDIRLCARAGFAFVLMQHPTVNHKVDVVEVHQNCFRASGPPLNPAAMITPEEAEREIYGETYTVLPSGRAICCQLTLSNGHTEEGIAHVIDGENFNLKKGRDAARRKAMDGVFRFIAQRKRDFIGRRSHTQD